MKLQTVASILGIIIASGTIVSAVIVGTVKSLKYIYAMSGNIEKICNQQPVILKGLFACLDGLHQKGCNGEVTGAREELLNELTKK